MAKRMRLDALLVEQGLAPDVKTARAIIMSGNVLVDDRPETKAGTRIAVDAELRLKNPPPQYVSRGGLKLAGALDSFGLSPAERIVIDVGASTGGFTDCLLQRGARLVYAVDVGYGQMAWKLQTDPRVVTMDRTNIRHTTAADLSAASDGGPLPDFCVADVSFISLEKVLEPVKGLLGVPADVVLLIKPQFEASADDVAEGGVVADEHVRQQAIDDVVAVARDLGYEFVSGVDSDTPGAKKGNVEHLVWLRLE